MASVEEEEEEVAPPITESRNFVFSFEDEGRQHSLKLPVNIPFYGRSRDLVERILLAHRLPPYLRESLNSSLEAYIKAETCQFQDEKAEEEIKTLLSYDRDAAGSILDAWVDCYSQEHVAFANDLEQSDEIAFAQVYHSLIHSPALETLLQLEHSYAANVEQDTLEFERSRKQMQERHSMEMERVVSRLGTHFMDQDVNRLAAKQFEETERFNARWASQQVTLMDSQRREYREWVSTVQIDTLKAETDGTSRRLPANTAMSSNAVADQMPVQEPQLEESFTIHLGAQMKTMHNIRLVCCDVLDFCRHQTVADGGVVMPSPQRLQTAMSIYSSSLNGLILLVDNRINSFSGIKKDFSEVCHRSTDFHFPGLDQQLEHVRQNVHPQLLVRSEAVSQAVTPTTSGRTTPTSLTSQQPNIQNGGLSPTANQRPLSSGASPDHEANVTLRTGDFYITRHSNLSQVHVVFHLVVDDTVRSAQLSARQPVLVGLRNILHTAAQHNIFNISVPLLLAHEMTDEMTLQWCMKRAELVFKCVKGFMMENSSWSGPETRTIQFLLPAGLSEDVFSLFTSMLPNVFRLANPLDLRD